MIISLQGTDHHFLGDARHGSDPGAGVTGQATGRRMVSDFWVGQITTW